MKLKDCFIIHKVGDQQMLISTDTNVFSGMVRCNESAGFIVKLLANDVTKEQILAEMKKEYNGEEDLLKEDIEKTLEVLKKVGALDE